MKGKPRGIKKKFKSIAELKLSREKIRKNNISIVINESFVLQKGICNTWKWKEKVCNAWKNTTFSIAIFK